MIIWSGGQTGVDRAAWDAAIACGLEQFGWVPKGRIAEDGRISNRYSCKETNSTDYAVRTEKNLREADATLIVAFGELTGGTLLTEHLCKRFKRPLLVIDLDAGPEEEYFRRTMEFLRSNAPNSLNVAGPRSSSRPDIYDRAYAFLTRLFRELKGA
ncbi:MAG: putative molybdenum carrier protein [Pseudomonadota bacterium]